MSTAKQHVSKETVVKAVEGHYQKQGKEYRRKSARPLNAAIELLPEKGSIFGRFGGLTPLLDRDGNQSKGRLGQPLSTFEMTDPQTGEVARYWDNGGLRGALALAKINPGALIEIESTGDVQEHPDYPGSQMREYKIYEVEDPAQDHAGEVTGTDPLTALKAGQQHGAA